MPLFNGTRPYEKLPFYLSLRIKKQFNDPVEITHHVFTPEVNPLPEFRELLAAVMNQFPAVLVYDDPFPGQFLEASGLNQAHSFFDLHHVFTKNLYYEPKTEGDTRLQSIAAAILNDKQVKNDIYHSDIEAATAYKSSLNNTEETVNFWRIMQQTSGQHLELMEALYVFLAGS